MLPYAAKPGRNMYRMDPYVRSIGPPDASGNMNAIVASANAVYEGGAYRTPAWNEAVIYELHIPTFNADPSPAPPGPSTARWCGCRSWRS